MRAALAAVAFTGALLFPQAASALDVPLHGTLREPELWKSYTERFVQRDGRVVDNANRNISHSEGQGFAMLLAVAADDRDSFARIWSFTREKLGVRTDSLLAWRWKPGLLGGVKDRNNASDGDILVAWALLEAEAAGFGPGYGKAGRAIVGDLGKLLRRDAAFGTILMPGAFGFTARHHKGREVVNLSYWVFPAFDRIDQLAGTSLSQGLRKSGRRLLDAASANPAGLPADWTALKRNTGKAGTAATFSHDFSYNAVRLPLYLAWSGKGDATPLRRIQTNWVQRRGGLAKVDVRTGRSTGRMRGVGYQAIAALTDCALDGEAFPRRLRGRTDKLYYPASLHLLSIIAVKQRYPQCW